MSDALYNVVYVVSAVVLLGGLTAVEIYRWRVGAAGRILRLEADDIAFGLGGARAAVELDTGEVVETTVPGCVQCLGRLGPGDRVQVSKTSDGYIVGLSYGLRWRKEPERECSLGTGRNKDAS